MDDRILDESYGEQYDIGHPIRISFINVAGINHLHDQIIKFSETINEDIVIDSINETQRRDEYVKDDFCRIEQASYGVTGADADFTLCPIAPWLH